MSVCSSAVVVRGSLILAVRISRADSSGHSSRVSSSVHVSYRHDGSQGTEWVVGAGSSRHTSRVLGSFPLHMVSKLATVSNLCSPPLSSSSGARNKSGDVSRGQRDSSLPLTNMVGKSTSMGNLCSPPGSSSRGSRDMSGDVARNCWDSSLASSQGNQRQGDDLGEHVETTAPM